MTKLKLTIGTLDPGNRIRSWKGLDEIEYFHVEDAPETIGITWKKKDEITLEWLLNWINEFVKGREIQSFASTVGGHDLVDSPIVLEAIPLLKLDDFDKQGIEPDKITWFRAELGPFTIYFETKNNGEIGVIACNFQDAEEAEDLMRQTAKLELPFAIHDLQNG